MAETQENNHYKTINRKDVFDEVVDGNDPDMLNKPQQNIHAKENYNNYKNIASFGDERVDDLLDLANDDASAVETANLLLSEHQPNFVDFDEFNICLNNILSDDVDSQLELSPSAVISDTLATVEVDEFFKVNIDVDNKSSSHMPTSTLNKKTISSTNSSSSSNSSISQSSLHNEQMYQTKHNNQDHNDNIDDDEDLLNMVQFGDHMDLTIPSDLGRTTPVNSHATTTTTHITTSIVNAKYNKSSLDTRHCLNHQGHKYSIGKTNAHNDDLDLNMVVNPINIQSTYNSTATVSASLTTSPATRSININNDEDEEYNDGTPQETALNNVIKRNSHSIVNIFQ